MALWTVFKGEDTGFGRISLVSSYNPNRLGNIMLISLIFILMKFNFRSLKSLVFTLAVASLFGYVIFIGGSRQVIMVFALLIFVWMGYLLFYGISKLKTSLIFVVFYVLVFFVAVYLVPRIINLYDLYTKFISLFTLDDSSAQARMRLSTIALDLFKDSPLVGIGFDQFKVSDEVQTYSHSTYTELLATTGILGTTVMLSSLFSVLINSLIRYKAANEPRKKYAYFILLSGFICVLIMGVAMVYFYSIPIFIFLGVVISYNKLDKQKHVTRLT
jgi:O-antigen ligase